VVRVLFGGEDRQPVRVLPGGAITITGCYEEQPIDQGVCAQLIVDNVATGLYRVRNGFLKGVPETGCNGH
jgi:hypothetical protein